MTGAFARRWILPLALCAALGFTLLLAGRSSAAPNADFTFVNEGEPSSLDPQQVSGVLEGRVMRFLYEGLVVRDPRTLAPLPGAARSWEIDEAGTRYTFHLREGARWSNGDELVASDFAYGFRRLLDPRTAAPYAELLDVVRGAREYRASFDPRGRASRSFESVGVRAPDPYTLAIELEHAEPAFLDLCAHSALAPLPQRHLEALRARFGERWELEWGRASNLVVDGPYRLVERRIRDRLRFEKNPHYWDAANVAFARVDCLSVEHPSTMLNLFLTGAAGWTPNFPMLLASELVERGLLAPAPQLGTAFYRFNTTRPPLDDARVRRALSLAIDRRALVERITRAGEIPQWSFVPACARDYVPAELAHESFAADCARARALLAQAGFGPGGRTLAPIEIQYNTQANNKDVAEVIADGWKRALGVDAHLASREWKIFLDAQRSLDYQVSRSSWVGDQPDALGFLEIFRAASPNNRTGWSDARFEELLERARRATTGRAALLHEAEALLVDEAPIAPLYGYTTKNLVDARLDGFFENPLDEHSPKFWRWKPRAPGESAHGAR